MVPAMRDPAGGGTAPRILPGFVLGAIVLGAGALLAPRDLSAQTASGAGSGSGAGRIEGPIEVTGVRASRGDGVNCPEIRDDAGGRHPVSYLPPRIGLGDRVTVTGTLGVMTTCRGVVLVVDELVEGAQGNGAPGGG